MSQLTNQERRDIASTTERLTDMEVARSRGALCTRRPCVLGRAHESDHMRQDGTRFA